MDSNGLITVVISAVISAAIACFTARIKCNQAVKEHIDKKIYERKEILYIDIFMKLEELLECPELVFKYKDFIKPMKKLLARARLYASYDVQTELNDFIHKAEGKWNFYDEFNDPVQEYNRFQQRVYDAEQTGENITREQFEYEEAIQLEDWIKRNIFSVEELESLIEKLALKMREELKGRGVVWRREHHNRN